MIYATRIKMKSACYNSQMLVEIDSVYLKGDGNDGYFKKGLIYDFLKKSSDNIIKVDISPYPKLIPALSVNNEKYVRSTANDYEHDNLLELPRD